MATATLTAADRLRLKELLQKKYKWIDYKWDLVFWVTAIFVVAGAHSVCHHHHPLGTAVDSVGSVALPDGSNLHGDLSVPGELDGPLSAVGGGGTLSHELHLPHVVRGVGDFPGLVPGEVEKLRVDVADRGRDLDDHGMGVQLHPAGAV